MCLLIQKSKITIIKVKSDTDFSVECKGYRNMYVTEASEAVQ